MNQASEYRKAFGTLRQFVRPERVKERCELCSGVIADGHPHLFENATRRILCACSACALLFSGPRSRYKSVPRRIEYLANFHITDSEWDGLLIPIGMAFFFEDGNSHKITALYPAPGGVTESLLTLDTWQDITARNPRLSEMEPDVEALLANRLGASRGFGAPEYYLLPIDECYRLVGLIRSGWRGLSGGTEVWDTLQDFFGGLRDRAVTTIHSAYA
jgi:hypothetical protein